MEIIPLLNSHYTDVSRIYLEGIATGHATFQTESPNWEDWNRSHLLHSRFVAVENNKVIGWAALTPVSNRCVYSGVAEVSVYIDQAYRGKGIGNLLLAHLIKDSESNTIWTLQAGLFPENKASEQLHIKNGFRLVGTREKIGKMGNVWRDTILMERRSSAIHSN